MSFFEEEKEVVILKGNAEHCSWIMHSLHIMGVSAHVEFKTKDKIMEAVLLVPKKDEQKSREYANEYIQNTNQLLAQNLKVEEVSSDDTSQVAE